MNGTSQQHQQQPNEVAAQQPAQPTAEAQAPGSNGNSGLKKRKKDGLKPIITTDEAGYVAVNTFCLVLSFFSRASSFGLLPLVLCIRSSKRLRVGHFRVGHYRSAPLHHRGVKQADRPAFLPGPACPSLPKRSLRGPKYRSKPRKKMSMRRHTNCSSGMDWEGLASANPDPASEIVPPFAFASFVRRTAR